MTDANNTTRPWYAKGLNFECTGCGGCCTGAPGYVWVSEEEMAAIALHLALSLKEFKKKYTRQVGHRHSLVELRKNYDCIFLKEKKCEIYSVRPYQCRSYPFWPQNLLSQEAWKKCAERCEGINENAPIVASTQIENQRQIADKSPLGYCDSKTPKDL